MEQTVRWETGISLRQTFPPGAFVPSVTKSEQISVVVGEGEHRLQLLHSSTGAMIKKNPSRFLLSPGHVSITKCHHHGVGVGLGCSEVGLISYILGWNAFWRVTAMAEVDVINSIAMVVIRITVNLQGSTATAAVMNIKGAAAGMNIKGTAAIVRSILVWPIIFVT